MALPVLLRRKQAAEQRDRSTGRGSAAALRSPWTEFSELHQQMGKLLSAALGEGLGEWDRSGPGWLPAADVEETAEAYVVELELPGVKRDDVSVEFGRGELVISGEVKERKRVGFLRSRTRPVGRFDYRVNLPAEIEDDQVAASLSDGVLTVRLPKTEQARPRRIAVTATSNGSSNS
jgi:HSP20 family protein